MAFTPVAADDEAALIPVPSLMSATTTTSSLSLTKTVLSPNTKGKIIEIILPGSTTILELDQDGYVVRPCVAKSADGQISLAFASGTKIITDGGQSKEMPTAAITPAPPTNTRGKLMEITMPATATTLEVNQGNRLNVSEDFKYKVIYPLLFPVAIFIVGLIVKSGWGYFSRKTCPV
jgi:hypothetical protein